jgi:hypothetical protein
MIWKTSTDSTRIATKDGSLAVRVDGDPHKDPLLLCQRFRGTMEAEVYRKLGGRG